MDRLSDIGVIKELLRRYGFSFSKAMGQNFLINPSVCPRMAQMCGATKKDGVLEIGPGIGVLTRELAKQAERVVAIELDQRLLPVLQETVLDEHTNVELVHGDVLKLPLRELLQNQFQPGQRVYVCANLPYYITSPILMRLLEERLPVETITVMVQKEAASRLCALPGTRESGAVSVAVQYYAQARVLFPVSRGSFLPAPNVDSCVMQLHVRQYPAVQVEDERRFFRLVKAAFGQRRRTLLNALSNALLYDKGEIAAAMKRAGIPEQARAESVTIDQFAALDTALEALTMGSQT